MKKRGYVAVGLLGIMLVFSGCKKEENVISLTQYSQFKDIDTSSYVTIKDYKGFNISKDTIPVSESEIQTSIGVVLYDQGYYVDAYDSPIKKDYLVKINVSGSINGKENPGFTSEGYEFVYGHEEQIMDGFTSRLKGLYQGEQVQFDLEVPSTFGESSLIGKIVTFTVSIESVQSYFIPELTDELVKEISDVDTIEEYREILIPELQEKKFERLKENKKSEVWKLISDESEVISYPEGAISAKEEQLREKLEMYAQIQGLELEDYTSTYFGVTYDEYIQLSVKQDLLLDAIGRAENITLTQKEYEEGVQSYTSLYGYNDSKTMLDTIGEDKVKEALLWDKIMQFVAEQVVIEG